MTKTQSLMSGAVVLAVGFILGSGVGPNATAQVHISPTPRFQISAWAHPGNPSHPTPREGYYILDTISGQLWQSDSSGKPIRVSEKLP